VRVHRAPYTACAISAFAVTLPQRPFSSVCAVVGAATLLALCSDEAQAPQPLGACVPAERFAPADPEQSILAKYLSRRFFIAGVAAERVVDAAYQAARDVGLDPYLVLAVIAIESGFNPIAESVMGAKGLMQIIPKYHQRLLLAHGSEQAIWDPEVNIALGARILQEYVFRMGTLEAALQYYNGALSDASAQYASRVMAERERLLEVGQGG